MTEISDDKKAYIVQNKEMLLKYKKNGVTI